MPKGEEAQNRFNRVVKIGKGRDAKEVTRPTTRDERRYLDNYGDWHLISPIN